VTTVRRTFLAGASAAAALVAALGASPAHGAGLTVTGVDQTRFPLVSVAVQGCASTSGTPVFSVSENGTAVPQSAITAEDPNRTAAIALAIDASDSMKGAPLRDALAAAQTFVASKRTNDRVAVYTFGKVAGVAQPMTSDAASLNASLGSVAVSSEQGTALYDAVQQASDDLSTAPGGRRVLVVLSDGGDTSSTASLAAAVGAAHAADAVVYSIALQTAQTRVAPLRQLASGTGGRLYTAAGSGQIQAIYAQIARDLKATCRFTYTTTAHVDGPIKLAVSAKGLGTATTTFQLTHAPTVVTTKDDSSALAKLLRGPYGRAGIIAAVGLLTVLIVMLLFAASPEPRLEKRIAAYTSMKRTVEESPRGSAFEVLKALFTSTDRVFAHLSYWKRMASVIEQADLALRPSELFYLQLGAGLFAALVGTFLTGPGVVALIFALVGGLLPYAYVKRAASKRRKTFEAELPDVLVSVAASLRAGHSFAQAVSTIVKDGEGPAAKEFARVENETRLGRSTDLALQGMADRLASKNFEFVVIAVNIQRQVGGSLAEILDMVADTVRGREQFARKVKALTAMGRASAWVLLAMPFFLALIMYVMKPSYMRLLFWTSSGHMMMIVGLISLFIGGAIVRKMVNFRY
jgi:tight adherence protein B